MDTSVTKMKEYLSRLESSRRKDEPCNQKAYDQARELSALVSLAEFGNKDISKIAQKTLKKFGL